MTIYQQAIFCWKFSRPYVHIYDQAKYLTLPKSSAHDRDEIRIGNLKAYMNAVTTVSYSSSCFPREGKYKLTKVEEMTNLGQQEKKISPDVVGPRYEGTEVFQTIL